MSRNARVMLGVTLLTVPTIVIGGLALLGILSRGAYGLPAPADLSQTQVAYYRAGHAHAGVLLVLSLVIQIVLDHARLTESTRWLARVCAPLAAILVSGGFFGVAHVGWLVWLLYAGVACIVVATLVTGVGLARAPVRAR